MKIVACGFQCMLIAVLASCGKENPSALLLEMGYEVTFEDFIRAVQAGDHRAVRLMLETGKLPRSIDYQGYQSPKVVSPTALIIAAKLGYIEIVELLIEFGADVNIWYAVYDYTALMEASISGHLDIVKLLVDNGANILHDGNEGRNAINQASSSEIRRYLIEQLCPCYPNEPHSSALCMCSDGP